MEIQDLRRSRLRAYIREHFPSPAGGKGNVSAFAKKLEKQQSQIADMLDGRKPFGEKVARNLEALAKEKGLPALVLDSDALASSRLPGEKTIPVFGVEVTEDAILFAAEWLKLAPAMRTHIQNMVEGLVAEKVREHRVERVQSPKATKATLERPGRRNN